jgi:hypothetical protein
MQFSQKFQLYILEYNEIEKYNFEKQIQIYFELFHMLKNEFLFKDLFKKISFEIKKIYIHEISKSNEKNLKILLKYFKFHL